MRLLRRKSSAHHPARRSSKSALAARRVAPRRGSPRKPKVPTRPQVPPTPVASRPPASVVSAATQPAPVVIPPAAAPVTAPATQPPPVLTPPLTPPAPGTPPPTIPDPPAPPTGTDISSPVAMYSGTFGVAEATRLLWRAGFGPRPGEAETLANLGLQAAVCSLSRPSGPAKLVGPAPYNKDGTPLDPVNAYQVDALYWMDRMIRSDQQLVERLSLILHDWFATNENNIERLLMLQQTNTFRANGLGSFMDLTAAMVSDPALILFLSGNKNVAWAVNENFGRELQELFTLGAGNGYTQNDVHEMARALTGWQYAEGPGGEDDMENFHIEPKCHDYTSKTIYGQSGNFGWQDVARMVVQHPDHPAYFVTKLWSYFITTPPSGSDLAALASAYSSSGFQIRPIVEAILCHPAFYSDANMVKPPVVFIVGMLRARNIYVDGETWNWNATACGQMIYQPPDVGGWDKSAWLNSNTMLGRWQTVYTVTARDAYNGETFATYNPTESPADAVAAALQYWNMPALRPATVTALTSYASTIAATPNPGLRAQRQNALRHLVAISPDYQVC